MFYTIKEITMEELKRCAKFRTKHRLPVLTWANSKIQGSIWRSSQNKTGITSKRSVDDEKLLEYLQKNTQKLHIYDARPKINAIANSLKGAGFENTSNYKNSQIFFCNIDNIHAVKNSYDKMINLSLLNL